MSTAAAPARVAYPQLRARPSAKPVFSSLAIAGCDAAAIITVAALTVALRQFLNGNLDLSEYLRLWPVLCVFLAAYGGFGLYPGVTIGPVMEIRRATEATTLVFLLLASMTFLMRDALTYSRSVFFAGWVGIVVAVPLARSGVRRWLSRKSWWGYPVVVFGHGRMTEKVVGKLMRHPERGLRPFAVLDDTLLGRHLAGVEFVGGVERAEEFVRLGVGHAVVAAGGMQEGMLSRLIEVESNLFPHVTVFPELPGFSSLSVQSREMCQMLSLQIRKNLLLPGPQMVKRVMDVAFSVVLSVGVLPLLVMIAIAIKIDSRGPVFFAHGRVGRSGKKFRLLKFRTMAPDSDKLLAEYLRANRLEAIEWQKNQKLKRDPRITRVGRWLRRTSLDELPQLWNVLRGEMSLVGPRPIIEAEIARYGECFALYSQVVPGLTGMWQVSGRNDTSYEQRIELDTYYVRNWSPWLDVYLVARTFEVVVRAEGAY